jgi:hypothetical protein
MLVTWTSKNRGDLTAYDEAKWSTPGVVVVREPPVLVVPASLSRAMGRAMAV